eukprot:1117141-Pelagomonas_calceolata.AAC.1
MPSNCLELIPDSSVFLHYCVIDGKRKLPPPAWPFSACPPFSPSTEARAHTQCQQFTHTQCQ